MSSGSLYRPYRLMTELQDLVEEAELCPLLQEERPAKLAAPVPPVLKAWYERTLAFIKENPSES